MSDQVSLVPDCASGKPQPISMLLLSFIALAHGSKLHLSYIAADQN